MTHLQNVVELDEISQIYCDAYVQDRDGFLIFTSLWGRDTTVQELLARISLPVAEGGIINLSFVNPATTLRLGNPDRLDKLTGRMPKKNLFGDLVNLFLFDQRVRQPDRTHNQAFLLFEPDWDEASLHDQAWRLFKSVCHLPMLDSWKYEMMTLLLSQNWLDFFQGFNINVMSLNLPEEELNETVSRLIKTGLLRV